jgi:uncharacterized protein
MELFVESEGVVLPASLDLPIGPARAAVVALHGAEAGQRSFFLYEHLAGLLPAAGIAVLRYNRRPAQNEADVPLAVQVTDAHAAIQTLRRQVGDAPIGLWGFSQGAWAATVAADTQPHDVAFLMLVSSCGVTPALQMRFGTAEQLRRNGFGPAAVAELTRLRATVEECLRGDTPRATAQTAVDHAAEQPWFPLAYLPRQLPESGAWADMDFDPTSAIAGLRCPTLLFYGETDEWMPIDDSIAAWRQSYARDNADLTIHRLPGCGHQPTLNETPSLAAISPLYTSAMLAWLDRRLPAL